MFSCGDLRLIVQSCYRRVSINGSIHAHDFPVDVVLLEQLVVLADGDLSDDYLVVTQSDAVVAYADLAAVPRRMSELHNLLVER